MVKKLRIIIAEAPIDTGEDAPPGHPAHRCVRKGNRNSFRFDFKYPDGQKQSFNFIHNANRSEEDVVRIARLCYMKCEAGMPKEDVVRYRDQLYAAVSTGAATDGSSEQAVSKSLPAGTSKDNEDEIASVQAPSAETKSLTASLQRTNGHDPIAEDTSSSGKPRSADLLTVSPQNGDNGAEGCQKASASGDEPIPFGVDEDAPEGHIAWAKSRYDPKNHRCNFVFKCADGTKIPFQTTIHRVSGSLKLAERICRLCYMKFEAGASKEDVVKYRAELYERCIGARGMEPRGSPSASPSAVEQKESNKRKHRNDAHVGGGASLKDQKRARKAEGAKASTVSGQSRTTDTIESNITEPPETAQLIKQRIGESPFMSSIRMEGRMTERKNSDINGIYTHIASGCAGTLAYRKDNAGEKPRILFYDPEKKRWKISNVLGDDKKGFAMAKVKDGGRVPPVEQRAGEGWFVFDGKEQGYNLDADVRCVWNAAPAGDGTKVEDAPVAVAHAEAKGSSAIEPAASNTVANGTLASILVSEDSDGKSSGSADSSSDSQSEDESDASDSPDDAGNSGRQDAARPSPKNGPRPPVGRVCAKMLVRSSVRCVCHFVLIKDCPVRTSESD